MNNIIQLWSGGWVKQTEKTNEADGEKNCLDKSGERKRLVCHFKKNEFWTCIGYIISASKYGIKG